MEHIKVLGKPASEVTEDYNIFGAMEPGFL
jgi:hypothetical protein